MSCHENYGDKAAYLAIHQPKKPVCEQMRIDWRANDRIHLSGVQKAKEKDPHLTRTARVTSGVHLALEEGRDNDYSKSFFQVYPLDMHL